MTVEPSVCCVFSPVESAKTTPLAIATGSGTSKSPEIQTGLSVGSLLAASMTTLNAGNEAARFHNPTSQPLSDSDPDFPGTGGFADQSARPWLPDAGT